MSSRALILEQLVMHPRYGELRDRLRKLSPVWLDDQTDAALTDAARVMAVAHQAVGGVSRNVHLRDMPEWLRLNVLDAIGRFIAGDAETCVHSPHPARPQPVYAAAWRPGRVVCGRCTHLLELPRGSRRDRTCDRCGHVCAGFDEGDPIYPSLARFGLLIYQYGTCRDCRPDYDQR